MERVELLHLCMMGKVISSYHSSVCLLHVISVAMDCGFEIIVQNILFTQFGLPVQCTVQSVTFPQVFTLLFYTKITEVNLPEFVFCYLCV